MLSLTQVMLSLTQVMLSLTQQAWWTQQRTIGWFTKCYRSAMPATVFVPLLQL
jgi:hypothetical protein